MSDTYEGGTTGYSTPGSSTSGRADEGFARKDGQGAAGSTKERLRDFANKQKDVGIDHVSGFASAAHKAADALAEQNSGIAGLVHEAADGLDRMSGNLRDKDVSEIYGSMQDFARRQPLVFIAGSVAAGILLARFLKSSAQPAEQAPTPYHPSPKL